MVLSFYYCRTGSETTPLSAREANAVPVRCMAARMLGLLSCFIVRAAPGIDYSQGVEKPVDCYEKVLLVHLNTKSALQRLVTGKSTFYCILSIATYIHLSGRFGYFRMGQTEY